MIIEDFNELYLTELQELHSAEQQLRSALPRLSSNARSPAFSVTMHDVLAGIDSHVQRLRGLLARHNADPEEHNDRSMQVLLEEADRWAAMLVEPSLSDAGLLASMQRVAHYESAVYGTVASYAALLGLEDDRADLETILGEKRQTIKALSSIGREPINEKAATPTRNAMSAAAHH